MHCIYMSSQEQSSGGLLGNQHTENGKMHSLLKPFKNSIAIDKYDPLAK